MIRLEFIHNLVQYDDDLLIKDFCRLYIFFVSANERES